MISPEKHTENAYNFRQPRRIITAALIVIFIIGGSLAGYKAKYASAAAGIPPIVNFQARLTNASDVSITAATQMRFIIYDAVSGGTCVWSAMGTGTNGCGTPDASQLTVTPANGVFTVPLGDTTFGGQNALPTDLFNDDSRFLEVEIFNGASWETLSPRKQIFSGAYAFNSNLLGGLATSSAGGASAFVPVTDSSGNFTLTQNVNFASNAFFVDAAAGRVGIGTVTPAYPLDVAGDINLTGTLRVNGVPFIGSQWGNTGSDIYYDLGNVGIGTSSPGDLFSVSSASSGSQQIGQFFAPTLNSGTNVELAFGRGNSPGESGTVGYQYNTPTDDSFIYISNYGDYGAGGVGLVIKKGGNVGIGTTSPANSLSVAGNADFSGNVGIGTASPSTKLAVVGDTNLQGTLTLVGNENLQGNLILNGNTLYLASDGDSNHSIVHYETGEGQNIGNGEQFNFYEYLNLYSQASSRSVMTLRETGNVGIGTASPAGILDVRGGAAAADTDGTPINLYAQNAGASAGDHNGGNIILMPGTETNDGVPGYVGIGTASPAGILDVRGGTAAFDDNGTDINIYAQNSGGNAPNGGNINLVPGNGGDFSGKVIVQGDLRLTGSDFFQIEFNSGVGNRFNWSLPSNSGACAGAGAFEGLIIGDWTHNHIGHICSSSTGELNYYANSFNSGSTDMAENYSTDPADGLAPGDLVAFDPARGGLYVKKATVGGATAIGVISTSPGLALSGVDEATGKRDTTNSMPVALSGRVPTMVSNENGAINIGDPITASDLPGVGAKAIKAGRIVGFALEAYNSAAPGKIKVFIQPGWNDGATSSAPGPDNSASGASTATLSTLNLTAGSDLDMAGFSISRVMQVSGVNGRWMIDQNGVLKQVASANGADLTTYSASDDNVKISFDGKGKLEAGHAKVSFTDEEKAVMAVGIPYNVIVTLTDSANGVYASNETADGFDVNELDGGTSGATFDWTVKARRKGYEDVNDFGVAPGDKTTTPSTPIVTPTNPSNIGSSGIDTVPPAAITDLAPSNATPFSIQLTWTAPGDDGATGIAASYDIRYSTSPIATDADFAAATPVSGVPTPAAAGTSESLTVSGLSADTTYYFAIKTQDEVPNVSGLSNVPSLSTSAAAGNAPPSDTTPPAAITDLNLSNPTSSTIQLTWTAPGDDGATGIAASYDIRYSTSPIATDADFAAATPVSGVPTPAAAGTSESLTVSGLSADTTYYFAIKTQDEVPNVSGLSNAPSLSTTDQ